MINIEGVKQTKILLVDDDVEYVKVTSMYLEENGLNIQSSTNPLEALEICKTENIDIILLDYFMPELTGEEFVKQLREFNNKSIVILQTGFSEKKPPIETLTTLDIQGYHDKTKGADELLLLTLSAIKTMRLYKLNRLQEIKLASASYKKQLLSDLSVDLIIDAKKQLSSINSSNKVIAKDTDKYAEENKIIEEASKKIEKVFLALGFENNSVIKLEDVFEIINTLLSEKIKGSDAKLSIDADDSSIMIKKNSDVMIFLIIETIMLLIEQQQKDIKIKFSGKDKLTISFDSDLNYDKEFAKKVVLLVADKAGIKFTLKDKKAVIYSEN